MCRSIKVLRQSNNLPAEEEVRAAALQFVRKISGFNKPSRVNEAAWKRTVDDITASAQTLLKAVALHQRPAKPPVVDASQILVNDGSGIQQVP